MKQTVKIEIPLLKDERIAKLIQLHGIKGLGLYVAIRILLEQLGACCERQIFELCNTFASRKALRSVLMDFDLFECDVLGFFFARTHTSVRGHIHTHGRAHGRAHTPVPSNDDFNNLIIVNDDDENENVNDNDNVNDNGQRVKGWLMAETNLPWREPMMMNCGYSRLMKENWEAAVDFFIAHAAAQDELHTLLNEHEARRYFTNFSRGSSNSGRALRQHLDLLEERRNTVVEIQDERWC